MASGLLVWLQSLVLQLLLLEPPVPLPLSASTAYPHPQGLGKVAWSIRMGKPAAREQKRDLGTLLSLEAPVQCCRRDLGAGIHLHMAWWERDSCGSCGSGMGACGWGSTHGASGTCAMWWRWGLCCTTCGFPWQAPHCMRHVVSLGAPAACD